MDHTNAEPHSQNDRNSPTAHDDATTRIEPTQAFHASATGQTAEQGDAPINAGREKNNKMLDLGGGIDGNRADR